MESENFITCPACGKLIDKRNPSLVMSHGCWNKETKQYECYDVDLNLIGVRAVKVKERDSASKRE